MPLEALVTIALKAFLSKIAKVVVGKSILIYVAKAFEIYSVFEAVSDAIGYIRAKSNCPELGKFGIAVVSDFLGNSAAEALLDIGSDRFTVEKTASGIYIASKVIPTFSVERSLFSREIKEIGGESIRRGFFTRQTKSVAGREVKRELLTRDIKSIGDIDIKRNWLTREIKEIGGKKVRRNWLTREIKEIDGHKLKRRLLSREIKEIPEHLREAGILAILEEDEERRRR